MRYMLMRKADVDTEQGVLPSQELLQAMGDYNERLIRAGVFVTGDGLRPSGEGCRLEFRGGEPRVIQGPFDATEELLAGYSVLEVESLEEAIEWAKGWPREDGEGNVTLELRRYFTMEDFDPGAGLDKHMAQSRMPRALQVHLAFPGTCREAMAFYAEVTGGHLEAVLTYGETPAAEQAPQEWHDRVVHASLNIRGHRLMGADMMGDCYQPPQGAQLFLDYADVDQAAQVFQRLAEGGQVLMPFEATFWAQGFGMATDRFGVHWMVATPSDQCP
ncbi:YciI family protein [Halomonas maura]|uniref:YciI family protein n=1 Tax=Halomonas maura TaxID=117606 RepID=UPI0025B4CD93|nr:YciI family protein [Halomonas maura]MDN3556820.1 YciI family protein [Halomonas maura]